MRVRSWRWEEEEEEGAEGRWGGVGDGWMRQSGPGREVKPG